MRVVCKTFDQTGEIVERNLSKSELRHIRSQKQEGSVQNKSQLLCVCPKDKRDMNAHVGVLLYRSKTDLVLFNHNGFFQWRRDQRPNRGRTYAGSYSFLSRILQRK